MDKLLSICIPTYNRAVCLQECLESILSSAKGFEDKIEINILDNASRDNTEEMVRKYQTKYNFINYEKRINTVNVNENIFEAASLSTGSYIWVFGDDDKVVSAAVSKIMERIEEGYNFIICNSTLYNRDFTEIILKTGLPFNEDEIITDKNEFLKKVNIKIGIISSIIFRKDFYFRIDKNLNRKYLELGLPFLFSIYSDLSDTLHVFMIGNPVILQRGENAPPGATKEWYECFAVGISLVLDGLYNKGYSKSTIDAVKRVMLRKYIMHDISNRRRNDLDLKGVYKMIFPHYRKYLLFWFVCVPGLFLPKVFIVLMNKIVLMVRRIVLK